MPDTEDFTRVTDRFRRELLAHCYRMLGSVHDAEDLVQETYLRAWRSYDRFDDRRASMRTWLYRIATNACLTALEQRGKRALPSGLGEPAGPDDYGLPGLPEVTWLEPLPDRLVDGDDDPATIVATREGLRLALVAAFQHLPPRQRAVLILRDVLRWRAAEVAELLGTTSAAVNSALQRARAQLDEVAPAREAVTEPADPQHRAWLDRFAAAFEKSDINGLAELLSDDVIAEMPPSPAWFVGRAAVLQIFAAKCPFFGRPGNRMISTRANGQPAFALYSPDDDGIPRARSIHVITFDGSLVSKISVFTDDRLFPLFGLPPMLPAAAAAA